MKLSQRQVWGITIGCFLSYFLFRFIDNLRGTTIPAILKDVEFNYSKGGTIIFSKYNGFFLATLFAGLLADLLGKKFSLGYSFRTIYRHSLFVIVPITVYFIIMRYPREKAPDEAVKKIDFKDLIPIISQ